MPFVVGVDSSTSACKVQVHDLESGQIVASGRAPHPDTNPPKSEQEPSSWIAAFEEACAQARICDLDPVALSVAAQQHGMVVLGEDGDVLRPAKLWNDTESSPDAESLLHDLPEGRTGWAQVCGSVPVPSFTITKLRWLARCEPDAFHRTRSVLLPHDWITYHLTGRRVTDRGDASGTGYWSPAEARYRLDLLALVDSSLNWSSMLPDVLSPTEAAGEWQGTKVLVGPGTGDNMAVALGLGLRPGDLALSFGTSATAFTVSETPANDPSGDVAGFADATGRFLPLVCTLNATKVMDSIAGLLGASRDAFDALVGQGIPGADGLVLIPHFDGERTPNRPTASGSLHGLRTDVSAAQVARATVEGVVCNLLAGAAGLPLSGSPERVFLVGGAAKGSAFRQIVADLVGSPVHFLPEELVATGAAAQAAATHQGCELGSVADAWCLGRGQVIEPDPSVDGNSIKEGYAHVVNRYRNE